MTRDNEIHPSELTPGVPLTRDDLAAMRLADSYSIHTHWSYKGTILRLYKRVMAEPAIFTKREQELFTEPHTADTRARTLTIDGVASGYGYGNGTAGWHWPSGFSSEVQEPVPQCFFSGYDREEWKTIVRTLRIGSTLMASWVADNNSENIREAGFHMDLVRLVATTGSRKDTFIVGWSCGPDNTARMVRRSHS